MRQPTYPLEPLARLRSRKADEAARLQAAAVREREAAESATRAAEELRLRHEREAAAVREAEESALARGELHAGDLARADSWGARMTAEHRSLGVAVDRAVRAENKARDAEGVARANTASRQADAQIVAKDRARWDQNERRRTEAREEEALSEACPPKR